MSKKSKDLTWVTVTLDAGTMTAKTITIKTKDIGMLCGPDQCSIGLNENLIDAVTLNVGYISMLIDKNGLVVIRNGSLNYSTSPKPISKGLV